MCNTTTLLFRRFKLRNMSRLHGLQMNSPVSWAGSTSPITTSPVPPVPRLERSGNAINGDATGTQITYAIELVNCVARTKTFGVVDLCEGVINEGRLQRIRGFAQGVECGGCLGSQTATPSLCNVNSANFCTSLA